MNPESARRIHEASVALLENPGVRLEHPAIVQLLLARGAQPGNDADVLRLPRQLIDECLASCPKVVRLAGRGRPHLDLTAGSAPSFWSCPGLHLHHQGRHRPFTSADMAAVARLLDQLDQVQVVFGMALDDVPPPARDVVGLAIMAANTSKHIRVLCFSPQGADQLVRMKPIVSPDAWFSIGFTAHGPLRWTGLALEIFRRTAGHGIAVTINGEPMAGVSGPVTLAGAATVGNAEILAGIVVNQILEPGRPCIHNLGLAHVFDMRTSIAVTGGPENHLLAAAGAALARLYQLPSASWVSSESMCPDAQAALEKSAGFLSHMQAGVSSIWGVGQLESEMTFSPAQAVIDNEIIAYCQRILRGLEVSDESLAVELTRQVGIGGSFLDQEHTFAHFRGELWQPELLFRKRRPDWDAAGCLPLQQVADARAHELMASPVDCGLSHQQRRDLQSLADTFAAASK